MRDLVFFSPKSHHPFWCHDMAMGNWDRCGLRHKSCVTTKKKRSGLVLGRDMIFHVKTKRAFGGVTTNS